MPDFIAIDEISNNIDLQTNNITNVINSMDINIDNNWDIYANIGNNFNVNLGVVHYTIQHPTRSYSIKNINIGEYPSGIYEFTINQGISNNDIICIKTNVSETNQNYFNIKYPMSTINSTNILFPYYNNLEYNIYLLTSDETMSAQTKNFVYELKTNLEYRNSNFSYRKSVIYDNSNIYITNNYIEPYIGPISSNIITINNAYGRTIIPIFKTGWYYITVNYYSNHSSYYSTISKNNIVLTRGRATKYSYGTLDTCIYFDREESNAYINIFLYSHTGQADITIKKDYLNFNEVSN